VWRSCANAELVHALVSLVRRGGCGLVAEGAGPVETSETQRVQTAKRRRSDGKMPRVRFVSQKSCGCGECDEIVTGEKKRSRRREMVPFTRYKPFKGKPGDLPRYGMMRKRPRLASAASSSGFDNVPVDLDHKSWEVHERSGVCALL
jgi:hypothetical protein